MGVPAETRTVKRILALAGGVGGAKLALGLYRLLQPQELTVVVNTGDDEIFHGLQVCPDLDTVMYTLSGIVNPETGWGVKGETFHALSAMEEYGMPTWFRLGDLDLATHIRRTELLDSGWSLSEVSRELCTKLKVNPIVIPMSDQPVRTTAFTDEGKLSFQEYFVKRRCEPVIKSIEFDGVENARMAPEFQTALYAADVIIFCPSNPIVSIGPILSVPGARDAITNSDALRIAVSPIVGGSAIKGPAAKMLTELGEEVSCVGIARRYQGLCDVLVIDEVDRDLSDKIAGLGIQPMVTSTIMNSDDDKILLARQLLSFAEEILG